MSAIRRQPGLTPEPDRSNPYYDTIRANNKIQGLLFNDTEERNNKAYEEFEKNTPQYLREDLTEKNALPWQRYLDDETVNDAQNIERRASFIPGKASAYDSLLEGVGAGIPESSDPMSRAIGSRFAREYKNKAGDIRSSQDVNKQLRSAKDLSKAANVFVKQQQLKIQNYKEQMDFQQKRQEMYQQWRDAQNAARANTIGSILGGIFGIGGAVAGKL